MLAGPVKVPTIQRRRSRVDHRIAVLENRSRALQSEALVPSLSGSGRRKVDSTGGIPLGKRVQLPDFRRKRPVHELRRDRSRLGPCLASIVRATAIIRK